MYTTCTLAYNGMHITHIMCMHAHMPGHWNYYILRWCSINILISDLMPNHSILLHFAWLEPALCDNFTPWVPSISLNGPAFRKLYDATFGWEPIAHLCHFVNLGSEQSQDPLNSIMYSQTRMHIHTYAHITSYCLHHCPSASLVF